MGPCRPRARSAERGTKYLVEVAAREQHGAAGLRALVVGGLVPLPPHPLGLLVLASAVAVGAGPAEVVSSQGTGSAPAHADDSPGHWAPRSAPDRPRGGAAAGGSAGPRRGNAGPAPDAARKSHNAVLLLHNWNGGRRTGSGGYDGGQSAA